MFLVNILSRKDTDQFTPLFEIIYGVELIFIISALVAAGIAMHALYKASKLPRIIRLRIFFPILIDCWHLTSRVFVMHHQYFGTSEYEVNSSLIFGSVMREIFLGYFTALVSILALDRWVATKAWAWYESNVNSTLLFFALQETILFAIATAVAILVVNEYISDIQSIYYFAVIVSIGAILFVLVFRHNLKEMREMKRGAVINRYSVARTYQIKENIEMLTAVSNIARPLVIVCLPPFIFYPIYMYLPANAGYDGLRFFSASMYDFWLSLASFVVISLLPYYFPEYFPFFKKRAAQVKPATNIDREMPTPAATADAYFNLLFNDLNHV